MGELNLAALAEILVDLFPIPVVVANLFTPCANGEQAGEGFDFGQGGAQLGVALLQMGQQETDEQGYHKETYFQIADDIDHRSEGGVP